MGGVPLTGPNLLRYDPTTMNTTTPSRWSRIKEWLRKAERALEAGPRVRAGIGVAAACLTLLTAFAIGGALRLGISPYLDPIVGILFFLVLFAIFVLLTVVSVRLVLVLAGLFSWRAFLVLAGLLGVVMLAGPPYLIIIVPFFLVFTLLGAAVGGLVRGGFGEASTVKKVVLVTLAGFAVAALVILVFRMASLGSDDHLVALSPDPVDVESLAVDDPSQPGAYPVLTLTYGSGTDKHRTEFGSDAMLHTEPVDATPFVKGNEGWKMKLREWYWGFNFESFPVNGRVWYPDADGPFPLVLLVHGNHSMEEHSDPGYAWLGKLMASRGFILVSVDENFFNGSWGSQLSAENDGRGWMLLRHLDVWRNWNEGADNPFAGKVDMERIALIGHSRGGEAAAIAASFNRLAVYPDDGTIEIGGGFAIRSVIAIAPSDGQYNPASRPTPLDDVNYLVIQGGHDSDVSSFMGARQWRRLRFTNGQDYFKASVWSYRSNHGQFNTVWGDDDWGWPFSLLLNRRPLLTGDEQRRFGGVVISAFLEATLNDHVTYRNFFRDLRTGADWLPADYYITRYEDSGFSILANFEEDVDLMTATDGDTHLEGTNLAVWREEHQSFRKDGSKRNGVVVLGWRNDEDDEENEEDGDTDSSARYTVTLNEESTASLRLDIETVLVFSIADTGDSPPVEDENEDSDADKEEEEADDENEEPEPVDLTVEVEIADGTTASIPLSAVRRLAPPLESRFSKMPTEGWAWGRAWEPALQTVEIPLSLFSNQIPEFDPASITAIALVFDRTPEGMVIVDDIGFAER